MTCYGFSKTPQERYDGHSPMEDLLADAGTLQLGTSIFNLLIS